ncbi:MAG: hypothetical protein WAM30_13785 [Candidatus Dormiibacterota bacterium]
MRRRTTLGAAVTRRLWIAALTAGAVVGSLAGAVPASAHPLPTPPAVSVDGRVKVPSNYTTAQLAALPQTTVTVREGGAAVTDTGVLLETLVTDAAPAYPSSLLNAKNELLRVTATVRGAGGQGVTFAVGELDANFGNHPALIALSRDGRRIAGRPELVVPGDRFPARFVPQVSEVTVGIATASATNTTPSPGSPVVVMDGSRTVTLSAAVLARLPSETLAVSFAGPGGEQTHTEVGPPLWEVLTVAGVSPGPNRWVAAVGSDSYVATVTPAEQFVGGRPLQLSLVEDGVALAQPRLVADGDVKGGRDVSDVVDLYTGTGPAR